MSVQGVRSFCGQVDFQEFSRLNLFIGQNGRGKTDSLFLLSKFPKTEIDIIEALNRESHELVRHDHFLEIENAAAQSFRYDSKKQLEQADESYPIHYFEPNILHETFVEQLKTIPAERLIFLEFIVNYVLIDSYEFHRDGFRRTKDQLVSYPISTEPAVLPSSAYSMAKTFTSLLFSDETRVVFFDEPETHLEPRAIRRFFEAICWLIQKSNLDDAELQRSFDVSTSEIESNYTWRTGITGCSDIPDGICIEQVFIASHSSVFVNSFMQLGEFASIYKFTMGRVNCIEKLYEKNSEEKTTRETAFVLKISESAHSILDELGCSGADILQANGVIWVEGPSDRLYVAKWLQLYALQYKKKMFREHLDYCFQMFGGTSLKHHFFHEGNRDPDGELFPMLSIGRNAFIITDSDTKEKDGVVKDTSNFAEAKRLIKEQQQAHLKKGYKIGIWFREGDAEYPTMESFLDEESLSKASEYELEKQKMKAARKIINSWGKNKTLDDFKPELETEIENLYAFIESWND